MKFKIKKANSFGWSGVKGLSIDINKKASFSFIEINTEIPARRNKKNDRVYLVVEGKASFVINGNNYKIGEEESIFIPKNTVYSYKPVGKLKILEANIPPFDLSNEVVLERGNI